MKIRVKSTWNDKNRERTADDIGSALGFNLWRIAGANVLHLENEGFQTDTYNQRLDVVAELLGFFVHVVDRMISEKEYAEDKRHDLITALALNLAKTMHDNRTDVNAEKDDYKGRQINRTGVNDEKNDYKGQFIQLLNERMAEYSEFAYDGDEPGFQMKRRCGEHVTEVMGEKDKKWVTDQIMEIEIPDALKTFKKVARNLI